MNLTSRPPIRCVPNLPSLPCEIQACKSSHGLGKTAGVDRRLFAAKKTDDGATHNRQGLGWRRLERNKVWSPNGGGQERGVCLPLREVAGRD